MEFEDMQVAGAGEIDLAGPIDLEIDVKLQQKSVASDRLAPFLDGLTDAEGWTVVPFDVTGTMAAPLIEFDMVAIQNPATDLSRRAVSQALEGAAESLREKAWRRRDKDDQTSASG